MLLPILLSFSMAHANQYDDLKKYAQEVPISSLDEAVSEFISDETNESVEAMNSHYTLALFENTATGRSWYILDGYYQMNSGRILFLDFLYDPASRTFRPIENYKTFIPGMMARSMLEAEELCNPYKRNFIGLLRGHFNSSMDKLKEFFEKTYQSEPVFILNNSDLFIFDPPKSFRGSKKVLFTLEETALVVNLDKSLGVSMSLIESGRQPSTAEVKKTYVGAAGTCGHVK